MPYLFASALEVVDFSIKSAIQISAQRWLNPAYGFLPTPNNMGYGNTPQDVYNALKITFQSIVADPDGYLSIIKRQIEIWALDFVQIINNLGNETHQIERFLTELFSERGVFDLQVGARSNGFQQGVAEQGNRLIDFLAGITPDMLQS